MISSTLFDEVVSFIEQGTTIHQLEEWLVSNYLLLIKDPISDDADLVAAIELGLANLSSGIINLDELRKILKVEISNKRLVFTYYPSLISTQISCSSNNVIFSTIESQNPVRIIQQAC